MWKKVNNFTMDTTICVSPLLQRVNKNKVHRQINSAYVDPFTTRSFIQANPTQCYMAMYGEHDLSCIIFK